MKILFISAVLPYPLHSGGQIRIYNLLKRLSKKHSITLLSFIRDEKENAYLKELSFLTHVETIYRGKALQLKYLLGAFGNYSWLLSSYNNNEMRQRINYQLSTVNYDLIHVEPFYVYASLPNLSVPLVVSEHNVEYSIYEQYVRKFPLSFLRPFLFFDVVKTRVWEETVWRKAAKLIAVSDEDKGVMQKIREETATVIPNGVDCEKYKYGKKTIDADNLRCLFIGDFAWLPNREAIKTLLQHIWPKIHDQFPRAALTIVGKQLPQAMKKLFTKDIFYRKSVPDIQDIYQTHNILLAPMGIGGGTKFKLLEAFAAGLVVCTSKQGIAGLPIVPDRDYFEAETPGDYAAFIEKICSDVQVVSAMTLHARQIIETEYNWNDIAEKLDKVWRSAV